MPGTRGGMTAAALPCGLPSTAAGIRFAVKVPVFFHAATAFAIQGKHAADARRTAGAGSIKGACLATAKLTAATGNAMEAKIAVPAGATAGVRIMKGAATTGAKHFAATEDATQMRTA